MYFKNNSPFQSAQSLHGDIPQKQRELTLKGFRNGSFEVLVATNVAARGLDIPEVDLVVQCSPPKVRKSHPLTYTFALLAKSPIKSFENLTFVIVKFRFLPGC